jgi:uncharacterized protein YyaL (SSP411 family)
MAQIARNLTDSVAGPLSGFVILIVDRDSPKEIVIVAPTARAEADPFLDRLRKTFLPNRTLSIMTEGTQTAQAEFVPAIRGKGAKGGAATAYVCEMQTCELPTTDPAVFDQQSRKTPNIRLALPQR